MKRLLLAIGITFHTVLCHADVGETRPLEQVFFEANVILYGTVLEAKIGKCGGQKVVSSVYTVRVTAYAKGGLLKKDVRACVAGGAAVPMLLGNRYLIAGNWFSKGEMVFPVDGVLLMFPGKEFYRLISFDSPVVASDRGRAYATGILEENFLERFGESVKVEGKDPWW